MYTPPPAFDVFCLSGVWTFASPFTDQHLKMNVFFVVEFEIIYTRGVVCSLAVTTYSSLKLYPRLYSARDYSGITMQSDNIFTTACKNCGEECFNCEYGGRTEVPLKCVPLSEDGLDEHAVSYGGPLSELIIDKGYWRATGSSKRIRECYHEKACNGGVTGTAGYCAEGYKGPCEWGNIALAECPTFARFS